ncbi:MAG: 1-(5-phosphoribosyl)-5-[(5-phosphoribosylamino)methylideneamino]imidazole-4-carboxamide isomerase [Rhodothermales bacterium]
MTTPTMLVIPAIDLRGGHCVRLYQGSYERETIYFDDPVKMAKLWRVQNAKVLHVVDLDAAKGAEADADNRRVIREICQNLDIPVQLGGGIRTIEDVEAALDMGISRVIIGTAAVKNPDLVSEAIARFKSHRVVVGIDARDGEVRVDGWTKGSGIDAIELALDMEARGCCRIVYTDISRDGTLAGPNIDAYRELGGRLSRCKITASGGVSGYRDLLELATLAHLRVDSVIVGRALYDNKFPCQNIWCWHKKDDVNLDRYSSATLRSC